MPKKHIVKPGESAASIAWRHGFADYKKVWSFGANGELANRGRTPYTLLPGDELEVPDIQKKTITLATNQHHRIIVDTPKQALRLRLLDLDGEAWANEAFSLETSGLSEPIQGTTDGDGTVEAELPIGAVSAVLTVREEGFSLALSYLAALPHDDDDPMVGAANRLRNLGYHVGDGDPVSLAYRWAVALFQADHDLDVTGKLDAATKDQLTNAHGV